MEVEYHAPIPALTSMTTPNIPAAREKDIQELLSSIEGKLPNVAEASQDLRALRILLESQLLDARRDFL